MKLQAFTDYLAGVCGGTAGMFVGYPFDTVKVRLQTQGVVGAEKRYTGAWSCFKDIVKTESVIGLYKGLMSPLIGTAAINGIIFGTHGNLCRYLQPEGGQTRVKTNLLAGMGTAFVQAFVSSPVELVKLRMQMQGIGQLETLIKTSDAVQKRRYRNSVHCFSVICKTEGIRGAYRGLLCTFCRSLPAFPAYFITFDYFCQQAAWLSNKRVDKIGIFSLCYAGGIAGIASWIVTFPMDVVKSRIQGDGIDGKKEYQGIIDCFKKTYQNEGMKAFGKGLGTTIVRAVPANAAIFYTVVSMKRIFKSMHGD